MSEAKVDRVLLCDVVGWRRVSVERMKSSCYRIVETEAHIRVNGVDMTELGLTRPSCAAC